jgi:peptidoglycan/xylan/chitin deacetylase (PgdA/CDA1 family)
MIRQLLQTAREHAHWLATRGRSRALILVYHRVTELRSDPWALAVPPRRFERHLEVLRRQCSAISLDELRVGLRDGRLPERAVVVTFDDGYRDNFTEARPLLERYQVPATFFVCTGPVGSGEPFWWDVLDGLVLGAAPLPPSLTVQLGSTTFRWARPDPMDERTDDSAAGRAWRGWEPPRTVRQRLFVDLWRGLRELPDAQRWDGLRELAAQIHDSGAIPVRGVSLDAEEIACLSGGDLFEIGAHSVRHSMLSTLSEEEQRREVVLSRQELESITGRRVGTFAYPFGTGEAYTRTTSRLVREAGYDCACTVDTRVVTRSTNPFAMPRIYAQDWGEQEFAALLDRWLGSRAA